MTADSDYSSRWVKTRLAPDDKRLANDIEREERRSSADQLQPLLEWVPAIKGIRAGHRWARMVRTVFWLFILVTVADATSRGALLEVLSRAQRGRIISQGEALATLSRTQLTSVATVAVFILTAVAFLLWIHRAHRNLPLLHAGELAHSPRWAVISFFVPVIFLFMPFLVVREIWKASDPAAVKSSEEWKQTRSSPIIAVWWGLFLLNTFVGHLVLFPASRPEYYPVLIATTWIKLISAVLDIGTAFLVLHLLGAIDRRQTLRLKSLREGAADVDVSKKPAIELYPLPSRKERAKRRDRVAVYALAGLLPLVGLALLGAVIADSLWGRAALQADPIPAQNQSRPPRPGQGFQRYLGREFSIVYPPGWEVLEGTSQGTMFRSRDASSYFAIQTRPANGGTVESLSASFQGERKNHTLA